MREGWKLKKLGALCQIKTGRKDVNQGNPHGAYPFFTCAASHTFCDEYSFDTTAILIAGNGDVGKVSYYSGKFEAYQRTYVLSGFSDIESRFLYHILDGKLKGTVSKQKLGNTMPYIKIGMLTDFLIPVPPLLEQRRIVAILDEAFEGIATAKANAEKNLQNAREIFESHLNAVFSQRGEGWVEKSLGELATLRNGINFSKARSGEAIKILGVKDFQYNYWAPIDDFDTIVSDGKIKSSDILKENDIVFVRSNGNPELIGRCLLVGRVNEKITHSGFTIRARLSSSDVNIKYLCHFLKLRETHRKMIDGGNGISIKSLNQETLSNLIIPLPRLLEKQTKIVNQVEKLSAETQYLESLYQHKLTALDELKQSLLHQAFNGDL